jgi:hypothetical protein
MRTPLTQIPSSNSGFQMDATEGKEVELSSKRRRRI